MKQKALALLVTTLLASSAALAVTLEEGTQEFGLQGSMDFDYVDDYLFLLNTTYGYFVKDDWEIGGVLDVNMSDSTKTFQLGMFTEYNFTNDSNWVPYLGAAAQLANLSADEDDDIDFDIEDVTALNIKIAGGVKYFINPHVAISAEVNYNIATDDISVTKDGVEDSFTRFIFGTRFYF
ncbi:outer membrane beta-barrel protein [Photobacterium halotolerans]|uniref:outer membrane beta-barrel protein n=1 Tax=Photobacterium halotolerans TaxID=265726 RepID=UPI001372C809|nr:outer membrane beta-barrel protein [Photobacterium halotolerans]NAX49131.1 outer membrane beta-barrel protein [Photobacterium halotolerans]